VRRGLAALILLALAGLAAPAAAQPAVVSPAPEAVSVTVYRNPARGSDDEWNSETRSRSGNPVRAEQSDLFQRPENFEHRGPFGQYNSR